CEPAELDLLIEVPPTSGSSHRPGAGDATFFDDQADRRVERAAPLSPLKLPSDTPRARVLGTEVQRPIQECCHLSPGDRIVWTVPVIDRRVAALGDVGQHQVRTISLEHVAYRIHELTTPLRQTQHPHQKRRHLTPGHRIVWTVPVIDRRVTPTSYTRRPQPGNVVHEHTLLRDHKRILRSSRQIERPHEKRRHLTPPHRITRT